MKNMSYILGPLGYKTEQSEERRSTSMRPSTSMLRVRILCEM